MSLLPDNVCLESQNLPGGRNCRNLWLRNLHLRDGQAQPGQGHQVDFNGCHFYWFGFGEKFLGNGLPFFVICYNLHYHASCLDLHRDRLARRDFTVRNVDNSGYTNSVSTTARQKART